MTESRDATRAFIFVGGDVAPHPVVSTHDAYIIAADSGLHTVTAWGLEADAMVGDMDSVDEALLRSVDTAKIERWSPDKAYSDAEIALMHAKKRHYTEITLIGGGGGRVDHFLSLLDCFRREELLRRWITGHAWMEKISCAGLLRGRKGMQVSFYPLTATSLCTEGLRWNLRGALSEMSLSNVFEAEECSVEELEGTFCAIVARLDGETLQFLPSH